MDGDAGILVNPLDYGLLSFRVGKVVSFGYADYGNLVKFLSCLEQV